LKTGSTVQWVPTGDFQSGAGAHLSAFVGRPDVDDSLLSLEHFPDGDAVFLAVLRQFNAIRRY